MPRLKSARNTKIKKKCVKSTAYPCGFTCIARYMPDGKERVCRNVLRGQADTFSNWLKMTEERLAKVNAYRSSKGKDTLALKNDVKLVKVKSPQRQETSDSFESAIAKAEKGNRESNRKVKESLEGWEKYKADTVAETQAEADGKLSHLSDYRKGRSITQGIEATPGDVIPFGKKTEGDRPVKPSAKKPSVRGKRTIEQQQIGKKTDSNVRSMDDARVTSQFKKGDLVGALRTAASQSARDSDRMSQELDGLKDELSTAQQELNASYDKIHRLASDSLAKYKPLGDDFPGDRPVESKPTGQSNPKSQLEALKAEENRLGKQLDALLNKYTGRRTPAQQSEIDALQSEYRKANRAVRNFNQGKPVTPSSNDAAIAPVPKQEEGEKQSKTDFDDEVLELENEAYRKEMAAGEHLIGGFTALNVPNIWEREQMGLERRFKSAIKKAKGWANRATPSEIEKQKKAIAAAERKLQKTTEKGWIEKNAEALAFEAPHLMMPSPDYERALLKAMEGDNGKALESYYDRRKKEITLKIAKGFDKQAVGYHSAKAQEYEVQREDLLKAAQQLKQGTILGVKLTGKADEDYAKVKASYRKLAKQHHPDRGGDPAEFRKVQAEWETFNAKKR